MPRKSDILKESLIDYYNNLGNVEIDILTAATEGAISLRQLELNILNDSIYANYYKAHIKFFKKEFFDPFRRQHRFHYIHPSGRIIDTSISQMNFIKWVFEHRIPI